MNLKKKEKKEKKEKRIRKVVSRQENMSVTAEIAHLSVDHKIQVGSISLIIWEGGEIKELAFIQIKSIEC
jgi:hypothetical protein